MKNDPNLAADFFSMTPPPPHGSPAISGLLSVLADSDQQRVAAAVAVAFPAPAFEDFLLLFMSLQRIHRHVRWCHGLVDGEWDEDTFNTLIDAIRASLGRSSGIGLAGSRSGKRYALLRTLTDTKASNNSVLDHWRAALWICTMEFGDRNQTALEVFASGIRGLDQSSKVRPWLVRGQVPGSAEPATIEDFLDHSGAVLDLASETMRKAWRDSIEPTLRYLASRGGHVHPTKTTRPIGGKASYGGRSDEFDVNTDEDEQIDLWAFQTPTIRAPVDGERNWDEPLDDQAPIFDVVPSATSSQSPVVRDIENRHLWASVWSPNWLFLTTHSEVIPPSMLTVALSALAERVSRPAEHSTHALGNVGLLLSTLTGRPASEFSLVSDDRRLFRFDGAAGTATFDIPELAESFRPRDEAQWLFERTEQNLMVRFVQRAATALRQSEQALADLRGLDGPEIERRVREATRTLAGDTNLPLTPARLRKTYAAHGMAVSGDLAAVQLLTGQTYGMSTAPLHYYAPTTEYLSNVVAAIQSSQFGDTPPILTHDGTLRIGAKALVLAPVAKKAVQSVGTCIFAKNRTIDTADYIQTTHQALVDRIACILLSVAGHRPTNALFGLTLFDFDLDQSVAVFRDKRIDVAHWPRAAGISTYGTKQILAYIGHLQALATRSDHLKLWVNGVLKGKRPLLFEVGSDLRARKMTYSRWRKSLPDNWTRLPGNWGRTYLRTRAVEDGLAAELAEIQLGHYEAIGYPFSRSSPTVPCAVFEVINPALDNLARNLGWRVARGLQDPVSLCEYGRLPLRDWTSQLARVAHRDSELVRSPTVKTERISPIQREEAIAAVWEELGLPPANVAQSLSQEILAYPSFATRASVEQLRDRLANRPQVNSTLIAAATEFLRELAVLVATQKGMDPRALTPRLQHIVRRPNDNPFFPQMFLACAQLHALRTHFTTLGENTKRGKQDTREISAARAALSLACFHLESDPDRILWLVKHACQFKMAGRIRETILIPGDDPESPPGGIRGIAAIAVAAVAQIDWSGRPPDREELEAGLAVLVPDWLVPRNKSLLHCICSTVAVARHWELSPAARLATNSVGGSTSASFDDQLALLSGAHLPTREGQIPSLPRDVTAPTPSDHDAASTQALAIAQYKSLFARLPNTAKELHLPLTNLRVPADQIQVQSTRDHVIAELIALLSLVGPDRLTPVVRQLTLWTKCMLIDGTPERKKPAFATVRTYLSRFGRALVSLVGGNDILKLGGDALEDYYVAIIEGKPESASAVARAIYHFQRTVEPVGELPEIDFGAISQYLPIQERPSDASLVIPSEREAAQRILGRWAEDSSIDMSWEQRRVVRQAQAALSIISYGGLRRGEALGMRFSDFLAGDASTWITIKPNRSRRLKTTGSTRMLRMDETCPPNVLVPTMEWIAGDRKDGRQRTDARSYVFDRVARNRDLSVRDEVASVALLALNAATRRPGQRLHRLRHLVAHEKLACLFLDQADCNALGLRPGPSERLSDTGILLPRAMAEVARWFGHTNGARTIKTYFHLPWMAMFPRIDRLTDEYADRRTLAGVTGMTPWAFDQIRKRSTQDTLRAACFRHFLGHHEDAVANDVSSDTSSNGASIAISGTLPRPSELDRLAGLAVRVGSLEKAARKMGIGQVDLATLRKREASVRMCFGRGLWPDHEAIHAPIFRDILPERVKRELLSIAEDRSDPDHSELLRLVADAMRYGVPPPRPRLRVDVANADALVRLMTRCHCKAELELSGVHPDVMAVQVPRLLAGDDAKISAQRQRRFGLNVAFCRAFSLVSLALGDVFNEGD